MRFFLLVLLLGCRRAPPTIAATDGEVHDVSPIDKSGLPRVRVLTDIATHHGKRVIVEGTYEIDPLSGKKKGEHLTWIVLDDGTRISRAYGGIIDEYGYIGHRVEVTGTITAGPPDSKMQALMAPHIQVSNVVLASGVPAPALSSIPAPPMVSAVPAVGSKIDRWVQVVGTLTSLGKDAMVTLSDGATVRVEIVHAADWAPHLGKTITVTGRLAMEKGPGSFGLDLVIRGELAVCGGVVNGCGMIDLRPKIGGK